MISQFIKRVFGLVQWCAPHEMAYTSDFCPGCVRAREVRAETVDERPEWRVADTTWRKKYRAKKAAERVN